MLNLFQHLSFKCVYPEIPRQVRNGVESNSIAIASEAKKPHHRMIMHQSAPMLLRQFMPRNEGQRYAMTVGRASHNRGC